MKWYYYYDSDYVCWCRPADGSPTKPYIWQDDGNAVAHGHSGRSQDMGEAGVESEASYDKFKGEPARNDRRNGSGR